jgi:hypothetical protein
MMVNRLLGVGGRVLSAASWEVRVQVDFHPHLYQVAFKLYNSLFLLSQRPLCLCGSLNSTLGKRSFNP